MTSAKSVCLIIVISLRFGLPPFSPLPRDDDSKTHSSHNQKFKTLGRIYSTQRIVNAIMIAGRLCAKRRKSRRAPQAPPHRFSWAPSFSYLWLKHGRLSPRSPFDIFARENPSPSQTERTRRLPCTCARLFCSLALLYSGRSEMGAAAAAALGMSVRSIRSPAHLSTSVST